MQQQRSSPARSAQTSWVSIGGTILELSCIFSRCLLSLLFIVVAQRLKARKFQLVALKTSPGPTASPSPYDLTATAFLSSFRPTPSSVTSVELLLHSPRAVPSLSTLISLPLPELVRDGLFDADVERVRKKIKGSNLKRKLAILSEVWTREVASTGAISEGSKNGAQDEVVEERGGFDPNHQKLSRYRGG